MDIFNFLVSIILIFLALQYQQPWMVFAILILSVLTIKSFKAVLALVISTLTLYILLDYGNIQSYFPLVIIGIVVIAMILGVGGGGQSESQTYPGGYADLLGGGGGAGGFGY